MPRSHRDAYEKAIDKVREQHNMTIQPARVPVECPKCGTRQILTDAPGKRNCIRCGYEFPPQLQKA